MEYVGRFWESFGGARMVGRLLGWLMICQPPQQSSSELAAALSASRGSVSTSTRQLAQLGMVERVTFPGDRASYYQLRPHAWMRLMEGELGRTQALHQLALMGTRVAPAERRDRVEELLQITSFSLDEWPGIMARLEERIRSENGEETA